MSEYKISVETVVFVVVTAIVAIIHWGVTIEFPITADDQHPAELLLVYFALTGVPVFYAFRPPVAINTHGEKTSRGIQIVAIVWLIFWIGLSIWE